MNRPDYDFILNELNLQIANFNKYLSPECGVKIEDAYFDVENKVWSGTNQINLGEVAYAGVYVIIGTDDYSGENAIYIGKASLSSKIGNRLGQHLKNSCKTPDCGFNYYGKPFTLYRVYTINFEKTDMIFMAPALEEYLITHVQNIKLLNEVGNR